MKIAYIHDFQFLKDEKNRVYSAVGMPEKYFDRFFSSGFTHVEIYSRWGRYEPEAKGFSLFENAKITPGLNVGKRYLNFFSPFFLRKYFSSLNSADLVVVNSPSVSAIFIILMRRFLKTKYVVEVATDIDMFSGKTGGSILHLILRKTFKKFVHEASGAMYVSEYFQGKYPNPNYVIASNVIVEDIVSRQLTTKPLRQSVKEIHICSVGGMNYRKGIDRLLILVQELSRKLPDLQIRLHLVGGHFDRNWQSVAEEYEISDKVVFHGMLKREQVIEVLDACQLYVQASRSEGLPRASIEAMSRGLPILVSDLPGFAGVVEDIQVFRDDSEMTALVAKCIESFEFYNSLLAHSEKTAPSFRYDVLHAKRVELLKGIVMI